MVKSKSKDAIRASLKASLFEQVSGV